MNLEKLFQMQKELGKVGLFNYRGADRFDKLILALLVELGECANEHRGFKFWSVNQLPHTSAVRIPCMMEEDKEYYNPLLEEYVDGLHFVLELGLELEINVAQLEWTYDKAETITKQFTDIYYLTTYLQENQKFYAYDMLINAYVQLGEMLGFTWEQIEQAYYAKNEINHQRQEVGY
jgi:dimeric dUTPase (all-alpha-NTP-PPase superfamily)